MPRTDSIAIVFVDKKWHDDSLAFLVTDHKSRSTGDLHILEGTVKDDSHPVGLWFKGVTVRNELVEGPQQEMDVMVPWDVIRCLAVTAGSRPTTIGFDGVDTTDLSNPH